MRQTEFDMQDQEAMDLANRVPKKCGGDYHVGTDSSSPTTPRLGTSRENRSAKYAKKARRARELLWLGLQAVLCMAISAAFMIALVRPEYLEYLAKLGVVCGCVAGGIRIDRCFRKEG